MVQPRRANMMNFYLCVIVICAMGISKGEAVECRKEKRNESVSCTNKNDYLSLLKANKSKIPFWCNNKKIICPVTEPNNVGSSTKSYSLQCRTKKKTAQGCEIYFCLIEESLYTYALLSVVPGDPESQEWKSTMAKILDGESGVKQWIKNTAEFWEGFRSKEWMEKTKDFLEVLSGSQGWLKKIKAILPGDKGREPNCEEEEYNDDNNDDENNTISPMISPPVQIVILCLVVVVLILAIVSFLLWRRNRKLQRKCNRGGASYQQVQLEKMMETISISDSLRNNELPPGYDKSHIYQEIPATDGVSDEVLQNPLYTPDRQPSKEQQSGSEVQAPAEGQYSLLEFPGQQ